MFLKFSSLLGDRPVEIRLNEEMSPSPSELLVDASAQSPTSDKTVEMFYWPRINIMAPIIKL